MAVKIEQNVFTLLTNNSMYQIKVDEYGVLNHLWYGAITNQCMDYLTEYPDVGFSGNIYDADNRRSYSLNTLLLEYSTKGVGDFRVPAVSVCHHDGSCALDLRYQFYELHDGKYDIPGLPSVYDTSENYKSDKVDENFCENKTENADGTGDVKTLIITLKDTATDVYVKLLYGVFEEQDVITRTVIVENRGKQAVQLERVDSLCLDMPASDWEWVHFHGRHTMERQVERVPLIHGIQESSSSRGTSSHQQNPTVLLCEKNCTEDAGFCLGAALMYSGGFKTQIELDQLEQVRFVMGIDPDNFSWKLEEGESFFAPEVILSCSDKGFSQLSHNFHKIIRNNVCRGKYKLSKRPVLINNWEATYFDFDESKIENIARQASKLGIDMMVLDDGWFGKRDSDNSGLGDWFVNENKLKGGLAPLVQKIKQMGMKFGIWFEPEMVSEDSKLYRAHPEWAIRIPGRNPMRSRYQLVLDMSNPDVITYLYEAISKILRENDIDYVKWDMNRSISDWYTSTLPAHRQKEMPHRYVLGLYSLLERLTSEFPDVLFEGCSGGGGRFDAGMLYYCPQIWCSDDTDAYERCFIQYGTSFFYPISTVGSHVSAVPNHQTGRETSLKTRGVVAMAGSFGYELDLNTLTEQEKAEVAVQVESYKKYQELIHNGYYYRLTNPYENKMSAWSFVSEDKNTVLVHGVVFNASPNTMRLRLKLRGIDENAVYVDTLTGQTYTGSALIHAGILLPEIKGDNEAFEFVISRQQ